MSETPATTLILDGDGAFSDVSEFKSGTLDAVACLPDGMASGLPSVMLRVTLDDGSTVLVQTSMRMFLRLSEGMAARYGRLL